VTEFIRYISESIKIVFKVATSSNGLVGVQETGSKWFYEDVCCLSRPLTIYHMLR